MKALLLLCLMCAAPAFATPPADVITQEVVVNRAVLLKNREIVVAKVDALAAQATTDREFMALLFVAFGLGMGALWFAFSRGHKEVLAAIHAGQKARD